MNKKEIIWYSFERDAVPQALGGIVDVRLNGPALNFSTPHPKNGEIVIGFSEPPNYQNRIVPLLIVTNQSSTKDVFSWLSTYAPETFPLSQFARVISEQDWKELQPKESREFPTYEQEDRWASLILAELLSQGESDAELVSIPFSRAVACSTTTVARTSLIYPRQGSAFSVCVSRLKKIESDIRFIRRPVSVSELVKTWEMLHHREHRRDDYNGSTDAKMLEAISAVLAQQGNTAKTIVLPLENYPGLMSNSMEERILAFQKLVSEAGVRPGVNVTDSLQNALVASAAFLVGRGTSHIFLLRRISRVFPCAILWFGAIAAMAGSKLWDPHWGRAVRGIEKYVRNQFHWADPSLSDLCWHEYDWLSEVYKGDKVFENLSKNTPNVISVEIVPGASCQMRLAASVSKPTEQEKLSVERGIIKSDREIELEEMLGQFLILASKAKSFQSPESKKKVEQPTLFKDDPQLSSKAPKKRAKGGQGFDK